jgi:large subunit ribosomal protein L1
MILFRRPYTNSRRYIRAIEVGKPPASVKYELAVRLKTLRNGPVLRNRIRLPHPVKSDIRIGVICPEGSEIAEQARQAGAVAVGEQSLFDAIKNENITFNRLICHQDSEIALNKAGLGRVLGPKGMMPSRKLKTMTDDVRRTMRDLMGADNYRERMGVVRMAVGQLEFSPNMLAANVKALVSQLKKDCAELEDTTTKAVHEVVLSSTNGPGFSLNGNFSSVDETLKPSHLSSVM